ncbi:MAG TPA: hypothetical protein VLS27_02270 [Gammaproteobacteria bacterium]|nr:hypothetical protein [Gammaproteobacteria bacterium]
MFILRFIGRILSIGLILFIVLIVSGKNAGAGSARTVDAMSFEHGPAQNVEDSAAFSSAVRISVNVP